MDVETPQAQPEKSAKRPPSRHEKAVDAAVKKCRADALKEIRDLADLEKIFDPDFKKGEDFTTCLHGYEAVDCDECRTKAETDIKAVKIEFKNKVDKIDGYLEQWKHDLDESPDMQYETNIDEAVKAAKDTLAEIHSRFVEKKAAKK